MKKKQVPFFALKIKITLIYAVNFLKHRTNSKQNKNKNKYKYKLSLLLFVFVFVFFFKNKKDNLTWDNKTRQMRGTRITIGSL